MKTLESRVEPGERGGTGWVRSYLVVSDLDESVGRAEERGAVRIAGPMAVGDGGTFVLLADGGGNMIGMFSPTHGGGSEQASAGP